MRGATIRLERENEGAIMELDICVLASGSNANSLLVRAGRTRVLIDAGLSARETVRRLDTLAVAPESVAAICLTHEHKDHCKGVAVLHARYGIPLYANAGTIEGVMRDQAGARLDWNVFSTGAGFPLHELAIHPFSVSHDAFEPVGFTIAAGESRIGIITDSGSVPAAALDRLHACDLVVMEANHDTAMLRQSGRPYALRRRIEGPRGHLSNVAAADALCSLGPSRLQAVLLAHLSADCNTPELATDTVRDALGRAGMARVTVQPTSRNGMGTVIPVSRLRIAPPVDSRSCPVLA